MVSLGCYCFTFLSPLSIQARAISRFVYSEIWVRRAPFLHENERQRAWVSQFALRIYSSMAMLLDEPEFAWTDEMLSMVQWVCKHSNLSSNMSTIC